MTNSSADVKFIFDSLVSSLQENADRKFVLVEMSFFSRWFNDQSDSTKDVVRKLVDQGKLDCLITQ